MPGEWNDKVFSIKKERFEATTLEIFRFQAENNPVYKQYITALNIKPETVDTIENIPFLPIRFFKSHTIITGQFEPQVIFESSGTTGMINSRHLVKDQLLYEDSFTRAFELFYGPITEWCIIGLLPSYLERGNSSLVYMTDRLIKFSKHPQSGFYLYEYEKLNKTLHELEKKKQKTLLIGVSFALLDFAEKYPSLLHYTTIMETGGMKGRREEITRQELHGILQKAFSVTTIHSEYGMTELLSQAYSQQEGMFYCPPWMKVLIREEDDPLQVKSKIQNSKFEIISGVINVIDLANIYSCSFIATDDVGKLYPDGGFEVLGRMDGSDLRGCNLLVI